MAPGDHDPCAGLQVIERKVKRRRGAEAEDRNVHPLRNQTAHNVATEPRRAQTRVVAHGNSSNPFGLEVSGKGPAQGLDDDRCKVTVRDAADVVFSENVGINKAVHSS